MENLKIKQFWRILSLIVIQIIFKIVIDTSNNLFDSKLFLIEF
jgi:hypothetical protein